MQNKCSTHADQMQNKCRTNAEQMQNNAEAQARKSPKVRDTRAEQMQNKCRTKRRTNAEHMLQGDFGTAPGLGQI